MELIGHCAVAAWSGVHSETDVFGEGVVSLMIPNMLHCHDWSYGHIWDLEKFPPKLQYVARQVRAHIIADWIIHYGSAETSRKLKCGWAYRHMGHAHHSGPRFFNEAMRLDLLSARATHPSQWSKKKSLDFAHSITEYALDLVLVPQLMTEDRFKSVKAQLRRARDDTAPFGRAWLWQTFRELGATSDQLEDTLGRSVEEISADADAATTPEAFAVNTTLRKYGFHPGKASERYVRTFLEEVAQSFSRDDAFRLCREIGEVIARPDLIYSGPWVKA